MSRRPVRSALSRTRGAMLLLTVAVLGGTAASAGAVINPVRGPAEVEHRQVVLEPSGAKALAPVPTAASEGTTQVPVPDVDGPVLTGQAEVGAEVAVVGVTWEGTEAGVVRLRARTDGSWSAWSAIEVQPGEPAAEGGSVVTGTEGDVVLGADVVQVQVQGPQAEVMLDVWGSDPVAEDREQQTRVDGLGLASTEAINPEAMDSTGVNGPVINTRQQWGADEAVRKWSPNRIESTIGITLHHTAGVNSYTADQVPSILRGIYQYHAVTLDWGDVGYNILVDKYGRAWEGRRGGVDNSLRTAQAFGMNYDTAGISLLGDYDRVAVPTAGFEAMAAVTAWKLDAHDLEAHSTFEFTNTYLDWTRTLDTVHMHRDVNQTACPGRYFAARIDEFRSRVADYQARDMRAVQRVSGSDRYETAANLAEAAHPWGADTVYLAQGRAVADVLAVAPAAARSNDAVLLTGPDGVPDATRARLTALDPAQVVVVGGPSVVPQSTVDSLTADGFAVTRLSGPSRYDTSAMIAQGWQTADTVYLASGREPADALAGGAAAAHSDAPLMLVDGSSLTASVRDELTRLAPRRVVILGGTARVSTAVSNDVRSVLPQVTLDRIAGDDRYDTSAEVALDTWDTASSAVLAQGQASVDAVAGTQLAAYQDAPLVLTRKSCQPPWSARRWRPSGPTCTPSWAAPPSSTPGPAPTPAEHLLGGAP